jgi:hypothetical protein
MRTSWTQRLIGLCAPSFGSWHATPVVPPQSRFGHAPRLRPLERARGVITAYVRLSIVAATIGDVATAAMQPTYLLAAICRADWVGWTRRMRRWRLTGGHRFRLACSICQCCSFTIGE